MTSSRFFRRRGEATARKYEGTRSGARDDAGARLQFTSRSCCAIYRLIPYSSARVVGGGSLSPPRRRRLQKIIPPRAPRFVHTRARVAIDSIDSIRSTQSDTDGTTASSSEDPTSGGCVGDSAALLRLAASIPIPLPPGLVVVVVVVVVIVRGRPGTVIATSLAYSLDGGMLPPRPTPPHPSSSGLTRPPPRPRPRPPRGEEVADASSAPPV